MDFREIVGGYEKISIQIKGEICFIDIAEIEMVTFLVQLRFLSAEVVTDSRQFSYTEGLVFFAISGKNHDGHLFIDNLYQKGIWIFVVERITENYQRYSDAAFMYNKYG